MVLEGFVAFLLDQVFPERCIICGSPTAPPSPIRALPQHWPMAAFGFFGSDFSVRLFPGVRVMARVLCTECWLGLEPAPQAATGKELDAWEAQESSASRQREPDHEGSIPLITPFLTNDPLLDVVKYLKFSGGIRAAAPLSWWMARALHGYLPRAHAVGGDGVIVTAVPLHPARHRRRGYNQAALLGARTAEHLGLVFNDRLLTRTRNTPFQSHLPETMRAMNVRDAFRLKDGASLEGRTVVLVDDLVTTGETVRSCARTLIQGGPASIAVLAAGRARNVSLDGLRDGVARESAP